MNMIRGSLIFAVTLFLVSILLLIQTVGYPFKARLFPLLILLTGLILLIVQIVQEILAIKERKPIGESERESFSREHLAIGCWFVATMLMLWFLGFMGTVILLPFLYLRFQRESWLLSILVTLGCGIFFYGLFGVVLKMPLYPGLLLSKILG